MRENVIHAGLWDEPHVHTVPWHPPSSSNSVWEGHTHIKANCAVPATPRQEYCPCDPGDAAVASAGNGPPRFTMVSIPERFASGPYVREIASLPIALALLC